MSFLLAAVDFVRRRALAAEGWEENLQFVDLAAHLFAIGSQLLLNEGSAPLMARQEDADNLAAPSSLQDLAAQLAQLPDDLDPYDLYQRLVAALVFIESVLAPEPSNTPALRAWTDLEIFPVEPESSERKEKDCSYRGIQGRVYHWIRPSSALGKLRSQRFEAVQSRPPEPSPHPGIYLHRLALYWDSDPQLPRMSRVAAEPDQLNPKHERFIRTSGEEAARGCFRIALCPLTGPFHPRFGIADEEGRYFQALKEDAIEDHAALCRHLGEVLAAAEKQKVRLVVFPELTIDAAAREHLKHLLQQQQFNPRAKLFGVVAGSFHIWPDPLKTPANEAVLLDTSGNTVMLHQKKGRFRVERKYVTKPFFPEELEGRQISREVFENISYGSELQIFDTSLGRLALLICADAIAADDRGYLPLVRRLRPDLLFVVAMTPETELFEAFAEEMSRHWIATVFVNASCICGKAPPPKSRQRKNLVALDLALFETKGAAPTRARWRHGAQEPECYYFKPASGRKGWRSLSKVPKEPSGISLLSRDDPSLGLLLDLGAHWEKAENNRKFSVDSRVEKG
jgi:predicted amidohydrolase